MNDHFADWEWRSMEFFPHGCNEVIVRDSEDNRREICSCDYWWMSKEDKERYESFRYA